ncbi:hypothetical protein K0651_05700 [Ornithinimicrobium sp. Arc0846-15]|nr:hypothetical protein [Ornithinimicrobium laminariae]
MTRKHWPFISCLIGFALAGGAFLLLIPSFFSDEATVRPSVVIGLALITLALGLGVKRLSPYVRPEK